MTSRLFIAVAVNEDCRHSLARVQDEFSQAMATFKWVKPANIHVTLVFLGDTPASFVPPIAKLLDEVAGKNVPFEYRITGLGFFGSPRSPRIIWAGVREEAGLTRLHADISARLNSIGISSDTRPFVPHITIARIHRCDNGLSVVARLDGMADRVIGRVSTQTVDLVESRLTQQGPEYTIIHRAHLRHPAHSQIPPETCA